LSLTVVASAFKFLQLPDSVWILEKESILGVCPANGLGSGNASHLAGSSSSSDASVAGPFKLLGGAVEVVIRKASDPSKMRVQITGKFGNGFVGFGVAKPGEGLNQGLPRALSCVLLQHACNMLWLDERETCRCCLSMVTILLM
jgi:hypothetical protein